MSIIKTLTLFLFSFTVIYLFTFETKANIFQLSCSGKNNKMTVVFSNKRKQVIITNTNNKKVKIKFKMLNSTPSAFKSSGNLGGLKTNITYNGQSNELSLTQSSLRGSNYFLKCKKPVLLKKE